MMRHGTVLLMLVALLVLIALTSRVVIALGQDRQCETDLTEGLVAYWSFEEGEGDIAFDSTGNCSDGGLMCRGEGCAPPKWVEGRIGYAIDFDGLDDYVYVGYDESLNIASELTVAAWIYVELWATNAHIISMDNNFRLALRNPHHAKLTLWPNGHGIDITEKGIPVATWTHLVGVYDGQVARLYVNALEVAEKSIGGNLQTGEWALNIGKYNMGESFFNGIIDEVCIYDRALTTSEVKKLYEKT